MADNETYTLLKTYAATRYTLTVAGTIEQFTQWYESVAGVRISERTFKRHTRALKDAGLIGVRHTRSRTFYTLFDFEFDMPKVKFLPASAPGQFVIADDGTETVSYAAFLAGIKPPHVEFAGTLPY